MPEGSSRGSRGVVAAAVFFGLSGALELGLAAVESAWPPELWPLWEALGRALMAWLMMTGLWKRLRLCRALAIVYCLATLVTWVVVLGLAWSDAPLRFSRSLVVRSLFDFPSCAVLLLWLRGTEAASLFDRPLFPSRPV